MYKNFNLTESEREEILNRHKEHGYKQPLNEQAGISSVVNKMSQQNNNPLKVLVGSKISVYKDSQQSTTPLFVVFDGQGKKVGYDKMTLEFPGHVVGQSNQVVQIQCSANKLITVYDSNNKVVLNGYNKDVITKFCSGGSQPTQYNEQDVNEVSDDNMDSGNLVITHSGCFPQHWVVDVNLSNDNGEEDSTTVRVMTSGDEVISVTCDDDDNLHSSISNEQAEEFVKQKIADGTLNFPPFIAMDGDEFHL